MNETEFTQRENLIGKIEGYYGPMRNLHKLTTNELIIIKTSIERLEHFRNKSIINSRNLKRK